MIIRCGGGFHDEHHPRLACGPRVSDDHTDHVVAYCAMTLDQIYLPRCFRWNDLGGGRVIFSEGEEATGKEVTMHVTSLRWSSPDDPLKTYPLRALLS